MTGFGVMLALTFGLSYYSLNVIGRLGGALEANTARTMDLVGLVRLGLREMVEQAKFGQLTYVVSHIKRLEGQEAKAASAGTGTSCHTMDALADTGREFTAIAARVKEQIAQLRPSIPDAEGQKSLAVIETGVTAWGPLYQEFLRDIDKNDYEEAHGVIRDRMYPILDEVDKAAKALARQRDFMIAAGNNASGTVSRSRWIALLLIAVSLVTSALVPLVIFGISRLLRETAIDLTASAEQVSSAAAQVSGSAQSLAQGTSEQAASLEETAASATEITSMTRQNAENARSAAELTTRAAELVTNANRDIEQMVGSMQEISSSSD
jgi:hypothetical protein